MSSLSRNISVNQSENIQERFDILCKKLGLDSDTVIKIMMKKAIYLQALPFRITGDKFYSEKNMKYLERIVKDNNLDSHEMIQFDPTI